MVRLGLGFAGLIAAILAYLLLSGGPRPFRGNTSSYNVLLITLDATRADHLGCYGGRSARTPVIDGLAEAGALFEQAYAAAVTTLPSHASILTGLLPPVHGIRADGSVRLRPAVETLAEVIRSSGYRTGAVVGASVLDSLSGLDQGFEAYDDALPEGASGGNDFAERDAGDVTDAALRFVGRVKAERWFLWVQYFDPHEPYRPPSPYREQYAKSRYDGEIAYVDAEIGRLMAGIAETGARDRTIVVLTADHGEGLRDHGERSHGVFLYDEVTRVPLIVTVPGFLEGSKRVAAVVRATDIMPTVLDLLRLPPRPASDGISLWPLMDSQTDDLSLSAYSESAAPLLLYGWSPMAALREGKWKLIQAPRPELYDLSADPRERSDLLGAESARAASLRDRLDRRLRDAVEAGRGLESVAASPEPSSRLRSTGDAGGGGSKDPLDADPMLLLEGGARGLPDPKDRLELLDRINRVELAYHASDFQTAVSLARGILEESPDNDAVRRYLAHAYRSLNLFDPALAEYRTLLSKNPADVNLMLDVGGILLDRGDLDRAKETFEQVLTLNPGHPYALSGLGGVFFAKGDFPSAMQYHKRAVQERPNHTQSILAMARMFQGGGKTHEAEVFYTRVVELDPKNLDALFGLGWLKFNAKDYEGALKALEEASAVDPAMPELNLYRGDVLLALGRLAEAEDQYKQGIAKAPGLPQGYHGLGLASVRRGDRQSARRYFGEALRVNPSFAASREELRRLQRAAGAGG